MKQNPAESARAPKTAAILLSRQPLRPCGNTPWVRQVAEAVAWIKARNLTLLSSVGMQTWELATAVGSVLGARMQIFLLPNSDWSDDSAREVMDSFGLSSDRAELVPLCHGCSHAVDERPLHKRDSAILAGADLLIPISIRPGGYMSHALAVQKRRGKQIEEKFFVGPPEQSSKLAYDLSALQPNPDLGKYAGKYLVHWTRAVNDPWPDERPIDFYRGILESTRYPRTAFDTLCHMLEVRSLIATSRHMPAKTPTVSFTGLSPTDVLPLMRWRARFTEMSFEPYGIGIRKDNAQANGIHPVTYFAAKTKRPSDPPTWLTQSAGVKSDWRQECEYRHLGNCDLARFDSDALIVFCPTRTEATTITERFGIQAVPISGD